MVPGVFEDENINEELSGLVKITKIDDGTILTKGMITKEMSNKPELTDFVSVENILWGTDLARAAQQGELTLEIEFPNEQNFRYLLLLNLFHGKMDKLIGQQFSLEVRNCNNLDVGQNISPCCLQSVQQDRLKKHPEYLFTNTESFTLNEKLESLDMLKIKFTF